MRELATLHTKVPGTQAATAVAIGEELFGEARE